MMASTTSTNSDNPSAVVVGSFSQAIKLSKLVFTSGHLPIDPATGDIIVGNIKEQTRQALINLKEILAAAGSSLENVVKARVFMTNIEDFREVSQVYEEFFPRQAPPVLSCVEVLKLAKGAKIEIEAIVLW